MRHADRWDCGRSRDPGKIPGMLRPCVLLLAIATAFSLGGCGTVDDDRQWMKINQRYTAEDFRRDLTDCSKSGKLDDDCMRARGWVAITPKVEKPAFDKSDPKSFSPRGTGRF